MCWCIKGTGSKTAFAHENQVLGRFVWLWGSGQIRKEGRQKLLVVTNICSPFIPEHIDKCYFPASDEVRYSHVAEFRPIECKWYDLLSGLAHKGHHVHSLSLSSFQQQLWRKCIDNRQSYKIKGPWIPDIPCRRPSVEYPPETVWLQNKLLLC